MTTVDEVRDILFYLLRKINDFLVDLTTETPQPQPQPQPRRTITSEELGRRIEEVRRSLNGTRQPRPQPQPQPRQRITYNELDRRIEEVRRSLNHTRQPQQPPPPSPSHQEMIKKIIKQDEERIMDLQKQAHEKRIILNYLLDELIQRRERKEDANVIKLLEEEFERLRLERERLEKRIIELKEHIRFMQN